jgi:Leucine-rich repeat (LRR) protein
MNNRQFVSRTLNSLDVKDLVTLSKEVGVYAEELSRQQIVQRLLNDVSSFQSGGNRRDEERLITLQEWLSALGENYSTQELRELTELYLGDNDLTSLPPEIGLLTNLRTLYLNDNKFTSLPSVIGQLTNLRTLHLHDNKLTSLSSVIGQLTNLYGLYLHNNKLTSLPPEIGQLTNLHELYLDNNKLTSLPPEIGQLINLRTLYLDNNELASLPPEIGQLTNLEEFSVDENLKKRYDELRELYKKNGKSVKNLDPKKLIEGPEYVKKSQVKVKMPEAFKNLFKDLPKQLREYGGLIDIDEEGLIDVISMAAGEHLHIQSESIPDYEVIWHNHPSEDGISVPSIPDISQLISKKRRKNIQVSLIITDDGIFIQKLEGSKERSYKLFTKLVDKYRNAYPYKNTSANISEGISKMLYTGISKLNIRFDIISDRIKFIEKVYVPLIRNLFAVDTKFIPWDEDIEFNLYPYEPKIHS